MKGLQDAGKIDFYCRDCGRHLMVAQVVTIESEETTILTRIAVRCGSCRGYSNVEQVKGQFYQGAPDDHTKIEILSSMYQKSVETPECDALFESTPK